LKESDLGILLAIAGVGAAAFFLLRPDRASADGSTYVGPIYGTGTALREPVPVAVPVDEPGILESVSNWWEAMIGNDEPTRVGYKTPAQWREELRPIFRAQETSYAMPRGFLEAVADRESAFRHDIITCELLGGVGEQGIMQLRPEYHLSTDAERCNPKIAIPYAANYLAKNFLRFGTWEDALAAYNWGPGNVERSGLQAAPASTKSYIAFVKGRDYVEGFV
jgi:hypothetical protein